MSKQTKTTAAIEAASATTSDPEDRDFATTKSDEVATSIIKAKDKIVSELESAIDHALNYAGNAYEVFGLEAVLNREALLNTLDRIAKIRIQYETLTGAMLVLD